MGRIDSCENCRLMQYLAEVSMLDSCSRETEYAGILLYKLSYLNFTPQLPDITLAAQLVRHIAEDRQTNLLSEAIEKCLHCPQSSNCKVVGYFKSVISQKMLSVGAYLHSFLRLHHDRDQIDGLQRFQTRINRLTDLMAEAEKNINKQSIEDKAAFSSVDLF